MRKMKQLLAAGLMMSMIAATSAGTSVFASTPEVVETNESTKTESSKETAQKVMGRSTPTGERSIPLRKNF